jgi:UDP-glucose 4-epimerase
LTKVVVTGGAGFIGSNLAAELLKSFKVTIIDDLSTGRLENLEDILDRVEFTRGSVTDLDLLREAFVGAEAIFHQGAVPSVQRSVDNPLATNHANLDGTLNVLVAARDCGARKVIYASSSSVYGDTPTLPKREDMTPNPQSPYAVSKLAGEYYAQVFSELYGLETVSLRYFNVFGPRQDPGSDYAAVIPRFISRILQEKPPVIFGDGEQTRDFTFVKDVVAANILAMEGDVQGVFNIACGQRISLNELADRIMAISGMSLRPVYDAPRPGDIRDSLADISAARKRLGYRPEYDLQRGLEETVRWFSERLTPDGGKS